MAQRSDLIEWVHQAVVQQGGKAKIVDVAKHIWSRHEDELKRSGNLFYTWQYDMRWAALKLRQSGRLASAESVPRGVWAVKR